MADVQERQMIDDSGSLSDHEAQWQPSRRGQSQEPPTPLPTPEPEPEPDTAPPDKAAADAAREEATDPGLRYRPKHRAQKDKARPEDVPRIKELSAKLQERDREINEWKTKWENAQRATVNQPQVSTVVQPAVGPRDGGVPERFTFPAFDDAWIAANPNKTYEDWQDAKLDARDVWRDHQQQTARAKQQQEQAISSQRQAYQQSQATYQQRRQAYEQAHPERAVAFAPASVQQLDQRIPNPAKPLIEATIMLAENGPDLLYTLQQRPDLLAELALFSDGKPVTEQYVAIATQWLQARAQPGSTVAGASVRPKQPAKPPTTVRTGPMSTGIEPPGDGASLAEHEAFFSKKRR